MDSFVSTCRGSKILRFWNASFFRQTKPLTTEYTEEHGGTRGTRGSTEDCVRVSPALVRSPGETPQAASLRFWYWLSFGCSTQALGFGAFVVGVGCTSQLGVGVGQKYMGFGGGGLKLGGLG